MCTSAFSGASLGDTIDNFETLAIMCFFNHNERDAAINITPSLFEDDIYCRDRLIYTCRVIAKLPLPIQLRCNWSLAASLASILIRRRQLQTTNLCFLVRYCRFLRQTFSIRSLTACISNIPMTME